MLTRGTGPEELAGTPFHLAPEIVALVAIAAAVLLGLVLALR